MKNLPAFPNNSTRTNVINQEGMTLLDYFAGQALIGYATDAIGLSSERMAELCYDMAEAMLKEREERKL